MLKNGFRKEHSLDVIQHLLKRAAINNSKFYTWQNFEETKLIGQAVLGDYSLQTQKLMVHLQGSIKVFNKFDPKQVTYYKSIDGNLGFKSKGFNPISDEKLLIQIPDEMILQEIKRQKRLIVKESKENKIVLTRSNNSFTAKSKSIDLPFLDVSKSGVAFKIPASMSKYFYEKDVIKMTYLNNIKMNTPPIGKIVYIDKCRSENAGMIHQPDFRVGVQFSGPIKNQDFERILHCFGQRSELYDAA